MKNKSILAIMLVTTMGFVNAGIFDDIGNGIAGAADDVADFKITKSAKLVILLIIPTYAKVSQK
jgi:hypothetical protein